MTAMDNSKEVPSEPPCLSTSSPNTQSMRLAEVRSKCLFCFADLLDRHINQFSSS